MLPRILSEFLIYLIWSADLGSRAVLIYSLPTIVVAGNQSCGKSSLIEAISGVSILQRTISPRACQAPRSSEGGACERTSHTIWTRLTS